MATVAVHEYSEAPDRARELIRFLGRCAGVDVDAFEARHEGIIAGPDYAAVVTTTVEQFDSIVRAASEEEAEGAFMIVFSFLPRLPTQSQADVIDRVTRASVASTDPKSSAMRLRILATMYNAVDSASIKLDILLVLVRYASDTRQLELLSNFLAHMGSLEKSWGATPRQMRKLYLLLSTVLEEAGDADQAQVFLIRYLTTFEGEVDAGSVAEAMEGAKKAAVGYIKSPAISQRSNLPNLLAVKSMASDAAYAPVHALLTIFASGDLEQYLTFHAAHSALIASLGVDHDASVETMRLLTLCALAAAKATLAYADVAAALKVEHSEVEGWIVRAIARGLLDARMDQLAATVTVTRTTQRNFGNAEWMSLSAKLHAWRDNLTSLLGRDISSVASS